MKCKKEKTYSYFNLRYLLQKEKINERTLEQNKINEKTTEQKHNNITKQNYQTTFIEFDS